MTKDETWRVATLVLQAVKHKDLPPGKRIPVSDWVWLGEDEERGRLFLLTIAKMQ